MKSQTQPGSSFPSTPARKVAGRSERWPFSWFRAWDRFWFEPSDPIVLGLIRICAGMIIVYVHIMYTFDLLSYVGPDAWVDRNGPHSAAHFVRYELPLYHQPFGWENPQNADELVVGHGQFFWSIYYHVNDPAAIYAIHFSVVAVMVLFAIGLWSRVTSVLTWIGAMCYLQRAPTLLFGMDTMMNLLLIYLMIAPCGAAVSVDDWLRRRRERAGGLPGGPSPPLVSATVATRMMQINFCFIYAAAGTSKLLGASWWNGTALWGTIANSYFAPMDRNWYFSTLQFLSEHRWIWEIVMAAGCVYTLVLEIGFPFLVWLPRWRWWMVSGSVLLHTGIGVCMGLVTFGLYMLCLVMSFVPPDVVRNLLGELANAWRRSGEIGSATSAEAALPLESTRT